MNIFFFENLMVEYCYFSIDALFIIIVLSIHMNIKSCLPHIFSCTLCMCMLSSSSCHSKLDSLKHLFFKVVIPYTCVFQLYTARHADNRMFLQV